MSAYSDYLRSSAALLLREAETLKADDRLDEANHCRIRSNIFDVCATVLSVFEKRYNAAQAKAAYAAKLAEFEASWRASMDQSAAHGDAEKASVEAQKLAALADIKAHYAEME